MGCLLEDSNEECKIVDGMEKDRDRFFKLYHDLSTEHREYKRLATIRVERLLEEHKLLMTLCMRYEKENEELKRKIKSFE